MTNSRANMQQLKAILEDTTSLLLAETVRAANLSARIESLERKLLDMQWRDAGYDEEPILGTADRAARLRQRILNLKPPETATATQKKWFNAGIAEAAAVVTGED